MNKPRPSTLVAVGKVIGEVREKQKLTLRAVARKAKLSHQAVFRVEHGRAGLDTTTKVMRVLGIAESKVAQMVRNQVLHLVSAA